MADIATHRMVDGVRVELTSAAAQAQEAEWAANDTQKILNGQKQKEADQIKADKKAALLLQPNKSVTVQDLIDLGLI